MLSRFQDFWRTMSLRSRLRVTVMIAITAVVGITTAYLVLRQRDAMLQQMDVRTRMMQEDLGRDAAAIARTVAVASERALAVRDFLFLAQINDMAVADDSQIKYSSLVNAEGLAMVHTDHTMAGKMVDNPVSAEIMAGTQSIVRDAAYRGEQVLEAVVPLRVSGKLWGTVRLGMSLTALRSSIAEQQHEIDSLIRQGVISSLLVTLLLMTLGVAMGSRMADALVRPLGKLMEGALELQKGEFSSTVVVQGSPEFVALARAFNDMTLAVRRREAALQTALTEADAANRVKSEILANVSHELRTPLNSIINVPAALLEDLPTFMLWKCDVCERTFEPEPGTRRDAAPEHCPECGTAMNLADQTFFTGSPAEHKRLNHRAMSSGQHLLQVVNDLLDFSKFQAGKMQIVLDELNPGDLVDNIQATMQGLADAKDIKLLFDVDPDLGKLQADRVRTNQVLINLLGNAIKFTPEQGQVELGIYPSYRGDREQVHFRVTDTGIGIPKDKLTLIFEPFRQVDSSHTRSFGGTGLGLAITSTIVTMHGGKVWAESDLGKGSAFHVVLPRHHAQVPVEAPEVSTLRLRAVDTGELRRVRRVIVVDDDPNYLELSCRILQALDTHVDVVNDPALAFDQIISTLPDLLIIDVMMPNISGLDILRRLRGTPETARIPTVVSTAFHSHEAVVRQLGGIWLPKPWDAHQLAACLVAEHLAVAASQPTAPRSGVAPWP